MPGINEAGMICRFFVAAAALAVLAVALALPAEAAKRKRQPIYYDVSGRQISVAGRAPTRLTVRRRSYLEPGTETKQLAEHYGDYAYPPGGSFDYQNRYHHSLSWDRMPLPDPFDIPGWPKF